MINKKVLKNKLPDNIVTRSAYSAVRIKDKFNIKTKPVKEHEPGITYYLECAEESWNENYVVETGHRLSERGNENNGQDYNSHIFKLSVEREHRPPSFQEFSILGENYC